MTGRPSLDHRVFHLWLTSSMLMLIQPLNHESCARIRETFQFQSGSLISQGLAGNQKPFWTQSGFEGHGIQYRETVLQVTERLENKRKE